MKLVNFSVTNFRSITKAHKVSTFETTILIGRNNEGKSNLLKALSIAMGALQSHALPRNARIRYSSTRYQRQEDAYFWERDFPVELRERRGQKQSIFRLEFQLDDMEVNDFVEEIKSNLNGSLPLEIRFGEDNKPKIKVSKRGRGSKTLNSNSQKIAGFIARRIYFNYIPAVRTDKEALSVISSMISSELEILEEDKAYIEALNVIAELQKPILRGLANRIKTPLSEFLPNIKSVNIEITESNRRFAVRRDFQVVIDDGTPTSIEFKGDGVKSLATLGLLKYRNTEGGASIIAIEEPESHLHPAAIHQLNEIISTLSDKYQVIVSTHNPLFVDRDNIRSNIIIERGKALPAKSIRDIRELLGIRASDNLVNASHVLVVEGQEDKIALTALLPALSDKIAKSLKNRLLIIEPIGGAGKLPYKLSLIKNSLCVYHALLDNDDAGRKAFESAKREGLISVKNCTFITCQGMQNSEFEDCLDPKIYKENILEEYGVSLDCPEFKSGNKWSDRVQAAFIRQGKLWNDKQEMETKALVAECVATSPKRALHTHKRGPIDSLVESLSGFLPSNPTKQEP